MKKVKPILIAVALFFSVAFGLSYAGMDDFGFIDRNPEGSQEEVGFYQEALFALCNPWAYLSTPECCQIVGCCDSFGCTGPYHNNFDL